jgi:hypothetical protein
MSSCKSTVEIPTSNEGRYFRIFAERATGCLGLSPSAWKLLAVRSYMPEMQLVWAITFQFAQNVISIAVFKQYDF